MARLLSFAQRGELRPRTDGGGYTPCLRLQVCIRPNRVVKCFFIYFFP